MSETRCAVGPANDEIELVSSTRQLHSVIAMSLSGERLFVLQRRNVDRLVVYSVASSPPTELARVWLKEVTIGRGDAIRGMAVAPNSGFIFLTNDAESWTVERLKLPASFDDDVAACAPTGFIEIAVTKSWPTAAGPTGISITAPSFNVVVACADAHQLQEFRQDGSLVHDVELSDHDHRPVYAIKLSQTSRYVVSLAGKEPHCVAIVDLKGQTVSQFGASSVPGRGYPINEPHGLAIVESGSSAAWVLVADWCHDRVMAVNLDDMTASSRLVPAVPLEGPKCLCVDETRHRLYVGEFRGKRLLEFRFPTASYGNCLPNYHVERRHQRSQ